MSNKPTLSFWQIINMNVGFFGIQYSFGLQQSAVNPIYDFLGASPDQIPMLNLAGPATGLLIQPIIGALSDKTWSPTWGRRKPYFLVGALICSVCLFLYPFSSSLWMAAGLLWILDVGNNTAMEPYRAFVADRLDDKQQATGFQAQSFFTGFGQTLSNLSLFIFPMIFVGVTGKLPNWVYASFFLGAVLSIGSIWWSMKTTPELPPSDEEIAQIRAEPLNLTTPFTGIFDAIKDMPRVMWMLAFVYLFQWYALFCYWQNASKCVAQNTFDWKIQKLSTSDSLASNTYELFSKKLKSYIADNNLKESAIFSETATPSSLYKQWNEKLAFSTSFSESDLTSLDKKNSNDKKYEKAVSWTGLVNGWYNIVTFLCAFLLAFFAQKYRPKWVHFICLILSGIGFIAFSYVANKYLFFVAITGFGIGWASMMGIPYLMIVKSIPKEKYGVYMGIINMMIVIPMLIQTTTFGFILKNYLGNNPTNAITFAGVLLLIAAAATLLIKEEKEVKA